MLITGPAHTHPAGADPRPGRPPRRPALGRWLRRERGGQLPVSDDRAFRTAPPQLRRMIREIPLSAIQGTVEPGKTALFDCAFRPAEPARRRWERIWILEQRGKVLPPISVVAVGDTFAIRDGHHRVSVARARGAVAIDAAVEAAPPALR